jgi:hypothetical protein
MSLPMAELFFTAMQGYFYWQSCNNKFCPFQDIRVGVLQQNTNPCKADEQRLYKDFLIGFSVILDTFPSTGYKCFTRSG